MEELYRQLHDTVFRYVRRHIDSDETAEDITHDIFLKLLVAFRDGDTIRNAGAFLFRAAKHRIIDYYRTKRVGEPYTETGDDGEERRRDEVGRIEIASWMRGVVDALSEPYRTTLSLTDIERLPYSEVARRLGLTPSGVKSRVRRGRAMMRERLLACCRFVFDARGRVVDYESIAWRVGTGRCTCATDGATPTIRDLCGCDTQEKGRCADTYNGTVVRPTDSR